MKGGFQALISKAVVQKPNQTSSASRQRSSSRSRTRRRRRVKKVGGNKTARKKATR